MSQYTQGKVTAKALERAIKTSIKREISARGINVTTRRGNKELKFLTEKIAGYSFENIEQARIAGEKLGQYLAELFQQKKKPNLDGGLIRQVTFQKNIWSLAGLLVEETHSEETVSLKEGASQITATETIAEDQQMTIEEVAIEESEERSVKDYLAQELSDKSETTEQVEEITSQDSGIETTEESSPTSEAETNVAAEAGLETDLVAPELPDKSETTEQVEEITSQDSGVETTEESSPTSEAETNVAAEAGLETDGLS